MTKFREYYNLMIEHNIELFEKFREIHDEYALNEEAHQNKFNEIGEEVMKQVREYEARLCRSQEKGGFNAYTPKLAEKFQEEVRKNFPMIDYIGIIIEESDPVEPAFALRKINL